MLGQPVVLLIDDDAAFRETFETVLRQAGFDARTAATGEEGLALASSLELDLLLIDLGLPDMDGMQVVTILEHGGLHLPFAIVSGHNDTKTTVEAMRRGALDVISKPWWIEEMSPRVQALVTAGRSGPSPWRHPRRRRPAVPHWPSQGRWSSSGLSGP